MIRASGFAVDESEPWGLSWMPGHGDASLGAVEQGVPCRDHHQRDAEVFERCS